MTRLNWTIAIFLTALLAALIVLALVTMSDALLGAEVAPHIVDGVSSEQWFENIKPIAY